MRHGPFQPRRTPKKSISRMRAAKETTDTPSTRRHKRQTNSFSEPSLLFPKPSPLRNGALLSPLSTITRSSDWYLPIPPEILAFRQTSAPRNNHPRPEKSLSGRNKLLKTKPHETPFPPPCETAKHNSLPAASNPRKQHGRDLLSRKQELSCGIRTNLLSLRRYGTETTAALLPRCTFLSKQERTTWEQQP